MREFRTYGSVRGAPSNGRPYRNNRPNVDIRVAVVGTCAIFDRYSIAPLRGGVRRWI
jgi:hypothetical protein